MFKFVFIPYDKYIHIVTVTEKYNTRRHRHYDLVFSCQSQALFNQLTEIWHALQEKYTVDHLSDADHINPEVDKMTTKSYITSHAGSSISSLTSIVQSFNEISVQSIHDVKKTCYRINDHSLFTYLQFKSLKQI